MVPSVRRPTPPDPADALRWDYLSQVYDLLTGDWRIHAEERLASLFHKDAIAFLPRSETSNNPLLSITSQKCVLYDVEPTVDVEGDPDLSAITTPRLWPLSQERLLLSEGMNEALMRVDVSDDFGIQYRVVPAHMVTAEAHPDRPDVPVAVTELRWRTWMAAGGKREGEWTFETWDLHDPAAPVFRIEAEADPESHDRVDRTAFYLGDATGWPERYRDRKGLPVLPYVLYHARVCNDLWRPGRGREVVEGTLTTAALMTMWLAGFRDGAYPQRWGLDVEPLAARRSEKQDGGQVSYVHANPTTVLLFRSLKEGRGGLGQFAPAMDPKSSGEAIGAFIAQLAVYADLSPSDVSVEATANSGYQVVVSREGQRRAQRRQIPPSQLGDRTLLATAARLANANRLATGLPEDPAAYRLAYAEIPKTLEEIRAGLEEETTLLDAGLRHPVQVYLRFNPGRTEAEARRDLVEIAQARATLARAATGAPPTGLPDPTDDPSA